MKIYKKIGKVVHGENGYSSIILGCKKYMKTEEFNNSHRGEEFSSAHFTILVGNHGKPYFSGLPIYFSLSNTGDFWICAYSLEEVGLDVEEVKERNYSKIINRYFTEEEKSYVDKNGIVGFYRIWTRKEAFSKFVGKGLFAEQANFVENNILLNEVTYQEKPLYFREFLIEDKYLGAFCTRKDEEILIEEIE